MKVSICDICHANNKISYAGWRISVKSKRGKSLRLDACDNHNDFIKGKGYDKARDEYHELLSKPQKRLDILFKESKERGG